MKIDVATSTSIEYWVWSEKYGGADFLEGKEWRRAKAIATNPPDGVCLVERVVRHWYDESLDYDECQPMFERGPHVCFDGGPHE